MIEFHREREKEKTVKIIFGINSFSNETSALFTEIKLLNCTWIETLFIFNYIKYITKFMYINKISINYMNKKLYYLINW